MNFLERIDELLKARDLNKNQLAAQTGIPVSTIYGWYKKGYGSITLPTLLKLSEFFGCSMEYLVNGAKDIQKSSSPAALDLARKYDQLNDYSKKVVTALVDLELKRPRNPDYASETGRFNAMAERDKAAEDTSSITSNVR